ncbi:MAG: tripartite tricarboxylate transporter substrate binding protein [Burkholderiales bacterium]|nr:tripartite tricarboxylate transporter substrate binding protein [Burkholderiales bacterium]MCW5603373.1 tripartite tricarboxylate transporter substrate binding protein [Burkholderiales bacterium]
MTVRTHRIPALLAACCLAAAPAAAQNFPVKPVRIVVPFAPGGANDVIARVVAQRLSEPLGQQVLVDNRGGAGGAIGADMVAKAAPDGYTLLLANPGPNAINPSLQPRTPYDPVRDFSMITLMAVSPQVLVVHPSMPVRSARDLITLAKARPGQINYGSSGTGAITHLAMEFFKAKTGTDMVHIPYKGASIALTELIGGQVSAMFAALGSIQPMIKSQRVRAVGIAAAKSSPLLPGVPAIADSGVRDFEVVNWFGIVGPANIPRPVVDRLNQAINHVVQSADSKERFAGMGFVPRGTTPEELDKHIRSEIARWSSVIKSQNIRPE